MINEKPPVLEYRRVEPRIEEPIDRTGEWILLFAFGSIAIVIFLLSL